MNIALFGRHPSPAEHIVFPEGIPDEKMHDYRWMDEMFTQFFRATPIKMYTPEDEDNKQWKRVETCLYVEGYTPALVAFLDKWDRWFGIEESTLYLMHYQPDGTYRTQVWNP